MDGRFLQGAVSREELLQLRRTFQTPALSKRDGQHFELGDQKLKMVHQDEVSCCAGCKV
jgi:hypothetical protein